MGLLDNIKRLIKEDFPQEDQDLIGKIAYVYNSFSEQVVDQVNGNLDFSNLAMDVVCYTVTTCSGAPVGNNLVKSTVSVPSGVMVIKAVNQTDSTVYPTSAPFVAYTPNNNILKIKNISGLQDNNKYILTMLIIP